jgi:hypothetical protein
MQQISSQPRPMLERTFVPAVMILGIAVCLIASLRSGQQWDGDFALYIMNARNIALGLPYGQTPYLWNAANTIHPAAYPPGFPLLIAPVYAALGVNVLAVKVLCVATFVLFLFVFRRIALSVLSPPFALAVTAAMGLHPYIFAFENSPTSEFPFLFFCYGALHTLNRLSAEGTRPRRSLATLVAVAAVAIAAACITRPVGALIFPAAFAVSVLHHRRLVTPESVALCLAAAITFLAQLALPADIGTYVGFVEPFSIHYLIQQMQQYARVGASLFGAAAVAHPKLGIAMVVVVALLTVAGFVAQVRRRITIFEAFFVFFLGFLIVFPAMAPSRYTLPIWPLMFLYVAVGIDFLGRAFDTRFKRMAFNLAACVAVAAVYVIQYASMPSGEIPFSVDARQSRELFAEIEKNLPEDARLLARKPAIIALYTGHEATTWPEKFSDDELWGLLARLQVNYIVQDPDHLGVSARDVDLLDPFIERNAARLQLVFSNDWFKIYRTN